MFITNNEYSYLQQNEAVKEPRTHLLIRKHCLLLYNVRLLHTDSRYESVVCYKRKAFFVLIDIDKQKYADSDECL